MCRAELGLPFPASEELEPHSLLAEFLALSAEFSGETLLFIYDALVGTFAPFLNVTKH